MIEAVIALAGTIVVALIGLYQWRRTRSGRNRERFFELQFEAHRELAERVEDLHARVRRELPDEIGVASMRRDLNEFVLRKRVYLDDEVQDLTTQMADALEAAQAVLKEVRGQPLDDFQNTLTNIPAVPQEYLYFMDCREKLMNRLRMVLQRDSG